MSRFQWEVIPIGLGVAFGGAQAAGEPVELSPQHEPQPSIAEVSENAAETKERREKNLEALEPGVQEPATNGFVVNEDPAANPYSGKVTIDVPAEEEVDAGDDGGPTAAGEPPRAEGGGDQGEIDASGAEESPDPNTTDLAVIDIEENNDPASERAAEPNQDSAEIVEDPNRDGSSLEQEAGETSNPKVEDPAANDPDADASAQNPPGAPTAENVGAADTPADSHAELADADGLTGAGVANPDSGDAEPNTEETPQQNGVAQDTSTAGSAAEAAANGPNSQEPAPEESPAPDPPKQEPSPEPDGPDTDDPEPSM